MNKLNISEIPTVLLVTEIHPGSVVTMDNEFQLPEELISWALSWLIITETHSLDSEGELIEFGIFNGQVYADFLEV